MEDLNKYDKAYDQGYLAGKQDGPLGNFSHSLSKGFTVGDVNLTESFNKGYEDGELDYHDDNNSHYQGKSIELKRSKVYTQQKNNITEYQQTGGNYGQGPNYNAPTKDNDSDEETNFLGLIIVGGIVIFILIWLAVNVILPIALLNSALAFLILSFIHKPRKHLFSVLSILGGCYMIFDILEGGFSKNFVENVVKDSDWITVFVYINSVAIGFSTWFFMRNKWYAAINIAASNKRESIIQKSITITLLSISVLIIPILYHIIPNPLTRISEHNNFFSNQNKVQNNSSPGQNTVESEVKKDMRIIGFKGTIGKWEAYFNLTFNYTDKIISGTYYYPNRPNVIYTLTGSINGNNIILKEFTDNVISAECHLTFENDCYTGEMNNTDGRVLVMKMCQ